MVPYIFEFMSYFRTHKDILQFFESKFWKLQLEFGNLLYKRSKAYLELWQNSSRKDSVMCNSTSLYDWMSESCRVQSVIYFGSKGKGHAYCYSNKFVSQFLSLNLLKFSSNFLPIHLRKLGKNGGPFFKSEMMRLNLARFKIRA